MISLNELLEAIQCFITVTSFGMNTGKKLEEGLPEAKVIRESQGRNTYQRHGEEEWQDRRRYHNW